MGIVQIIFSWDQNECHRTSIIIVALQMNLIKRHRVRKFINLYINQGNVHTNPGRKETKGPSELTYNQNARIAIFNKGPHFDTTAS